MTSSFLLLIALPLVVIVPVFLIISIRYLTYRSANHLQIPASTTPSPVILSDIRVPSWPALLRWLVLLPLMGFGVGIILMRFVYGIGSVTNLSDQFPWGLWVGFDVMSGVALAAGAFVIAATGHIFRIKRFEPLVRPAILTGLLGYLLAVVGLAVDLGRPYNIWWPVARWQHHSVLWEVGICVTTYTTILFIEFLPVILERINKIEIVTQWLPTVAFYRLLKKVSIVFVILGVVLSTLHQSSLGSLFVLIPTKMHPLWYSIYLPVFFWLSAIAVGLAMTIVESTLSSKVFKRGLETNLLADLAGAASVVLLIYLLARGSDLYVRGVWPLLLKINFQTVAFWIEIGLGVIVPTFLFAIRPLRYKPAVQFTGALMIVIFGIVLNRLNVSITAILPYTGNIYFPSWMEILVTLTLISFGIIAFGLAVKYLPIFPEKYEYTEAQT